MSSRKTLLGLSSLGGAVLLAWLGLRTPDVEVIRKSPERNYWSPNQSLYYPGNVKVIDHRKKPIKDSEWSIGRVDYEDENANGTLDKVTIYNCKEDPVTWGKDCVSDVIILMNNSYSNYTAPQKGGRMYYEIAKFGPEGKFWQSEFEKLLKEYGN